MSSAKSSSASATTPPTIVESYAICRATAKREAKNFYYSFRVLPQAKSDAMCAVYAFMRRADDIADEETQTIPQRREEMARWLGQWRASKQGSSTDPVFIALGDAQQRFSIPDELMEELVRGTSMDLEEGQGGPDQSITLDAGTGAGLRGYATFPDLYRYCYLVASVVGLVCIRIFGYSDPAAELLAERTGVAFQLTNILRDIKEDAERGRIYLPQSLLKEFNVSNADVLALAAGRPMQGHERAMISALSVQAWEYYASSRELLPLIEPDSRGALWVLVEIYSRLLQRIDERNADVFSTRVSVPTPQKLVALARGAAMSLRPGR